MEDNKKINESKNNELNLKDIQQENKMNVEKEYNSQNVQLEDEKDKNDGDSNESISLEENENKITLIGNKEYDEDTLNRITKWANYQKRKPKTMGRPPKFSEGQKEFIYQTAEGKMTIINKVSARNIAFQFSNKFNETISKSSVNNFLFEKYGKPYRGVNSILLTEEHIKQRFEFSNEIIKKEIKSSDIIFTDECRIVLFPKVNPKINVIRLNDYDKKIYILMK